MDAAARDASGPQSRPMTMRADTGDSMVTMFADAPAVSGSGRQLTRPLCPRPPPIRTDTVDSSATLVDDSPSPSTAEIDGVLKWKKFTGRSGASFADSTSTLFEEPLEIVDLAADPLPRRAPYKELSPGKRLTRTDTLDSATTQVEGARQRQEVPSHKPTAFRLPFLSAVMAALILLIVLAEVAMRALPSENSGVLQLLPSNEPTIEGDNPSKARRTAAVLEQRQPPPIPGLTLDFGGGTSTSAVISSSSSSSVSTGTEHAPIHYDTSTSPVETQSTPTVSTDSGARSSFQQSQITSTAELPSPSSDSNVVTLEGGYLFTITADEMLLGTWYCVGETLPPVQTPPPATTVGNHGINWWENASHEKSDQAPERRPFHTGSWSHSGSWDHRQTGGRYPGTGIRTKSSTPTLPQISTSGNTVMSTATETVRPSDTSGSLPPVVSDLHPSPTSSTSTGPAPPGLSPPNLSTQNGPPAITIDLPPKPDISSSGATSTSSTPFTSSVPPVVIGTGTSGTTTPTGDSSPPGLPPAIPPPSTSSTSAAGPPVFSIDLGSAETVTHSSPQASFDLSSAVSSSSVAITSPVASASSISSSLSSSQAGSISTTVIVPSPTVTMPAVTGPPSIPGGPPPIPGLGARAVLDPRGAVKVEPSSSTQSSETTSSTYSLFDVTPTPSLTVSMASASCYWTWTLTLPGNGNPLSKTFGHESSGFAELTQTITRPPVITTNTDQPTATVVVVPPGGSGGWQETGIDYGATSNLPTGPGNNAGPAKTSTAPDGHVVTYTEAKTTTPAVYVVPGSGSGDTSTQTANQGGGGIFFGGGGSGGNGDAGDGLSGGNGAGPATGGGSSGGNAPGGGASGGLVPGGGSGGGSGGGAAAAGAGNAGAQGTADGNTAYMTPGAGAYATGVGTSPGSIGNANGAGANSGGANSGGSRITIIPNVPGSLGGFASALHVGGGGTGSNESPVTAAAKLGAMPTVTVSATWISTVVTLTDAQGHSTGQVTATFLATPTVITMTNTDGVTTATVTAFVQFTPPSANGSSSSLGNSSTPDQFTVETYSISELAYATGFFVPTILAVMIAIPLRILCLSAKLYQPFHALTRDQGATAQESLLLNTEGYKGLFAVLKSIRRGQPLLFFSTALSTLSIVLVPLSALAVTLNLRGQCTNQDFTGCYMELTVYPLPTRLIQTLLAVLLLLIVIIAIILQKWRSGVACDPWSIASMAALSTNENMRKLIASFPTSGKLNHDVMNKLLDGYVFRLGYYLDRDGFEQYGLMVDRNPKHPRAKQLDFGAKEGLEQTEAPVEDTKPLCKRTQRIPLFSLSMTGRAAFLLFACSLLIIILYYNNTSGDSGFENFMDSQTLGVRFTFSAAGMAVALYWSAFFRELAIVTPFRHLAGAGGRGQAARQTILLSPPSDAFSGIVHAARRRDPLLFVVAFTAIIAEFTPLLLDNVPFRITQTYQTHQVCTYLALAILFWMVLVIVSISLFVRWPRMPVDPSTIAGALYYVADAKMVDVCFGDGEVGTSDKKERDRMVARTGARFHYGFVTGASGQRRIGVDMVLGGRDEEDSAVDNLSDGAKGGRRRSSMDSGMAIGTGFGVGFVKPGKDFDIGNETGKVHNGQDTLAELEEVVIVGPEKVEKPWLAGI